MKYTNTKAPVEKPAGVSPYSLCEERPPANPLVRVGMSAIETVVWLMIMAVLFVCMIIMLWHVSK